MITRGGSPDLAREALHYVALVGEKRRFVDHAVSVVGANTTTLPPVSGAAAMTSGP
ncbi:hypothetical protein ACFSC3_05925 [Sphingomonas floccifaciens]|uniref:Uncharacterized protein n=1 Tax=Sphingomonas floccifaciens TaxID=1844115 RepID=A0ABW4NBJ2_9SPHN